MPRRGETRGMERAAPGGTVRSCDAPGCDAPGEFRAPRDRSRLRDYFHFCLPHVRAYNQAWDFYRGMSPEEIEQHLREDTGWQRPTWPLGRLGGKPPGPEVFRDPMGILGAMPPAQHKTRKEAPPELRAALDVLGLGWPIDEEGLRARYLELAKAHHPDTTGGDKAAEERLKDINRAYSLIKKRLATLPAAANAGGEARAAG
jgi:DnaJ-domain-containing protein 1